MNQLSIRRRAVREAKRSRVGVPSTPTMIMALYSTPDVHRERFEAMWQSGELVELANVFADQVIFREANEIICEMVREKIVSVDYRHAPEARYPAAADDGLAAVRWIAEHAGELGGRPGALAVAGWSAGGNLAAVVCQLARDAGGPRIAGQLLLTPVTDCDPTRASYVENADGYILTAPLMKWFWDHYADPDLRTQPKASPLRAQDLSRLPPAFVVTCEFDPLRDEGIA